MTRPTDVIEHQVDLIRWWKSPAGASYGNSFGRLAADNGTKKLGDLDATRDLYETNFAQPGSMAAFEASRLNIAPTYRVEAEMCDLVKFASRSMKRESLRFEDLPTATGFAWMERPFELVDVNGRTLYVKAFAWGLQRIVWGSDKTTPVKDEHLGIWLSLYDDTADQRSEVWSMHRRMKERGIFSPRLSYIHGEPWTFGTAFDRLQATAEEMEEKGLSPEAADSAIEWRRWIGAFFALVQQKVPRLETHHSDRGQARRLLRAKMELPAEVIVVTLRKTKYDRSGDGEPSDVPWTHRWWVGAATGGHWHTYHTKDGPKQRWVLPYVKGPEDRPLVVKDAVLNWRR